MHACGVCCRCAAALEALSKAQGLSNVQAADSYLCALLAAADGTLLLPGQEQQQQPDTAAAAGGGRDPATPAGLQRAPQSRWVFCWGMLFGVALWTCDSELAGLRVG
jgi:hypothetical protein